MKPYYQDNSIKIYNKDCRDMSELPDESVQCVVTSPPFWGLRKYSGFQDLIWGGDKDCDHDWQSDIKRGGAGQGEYTGSTRWQHIAEEAQDRGIPVRDVEPEAWTKDRPQFAFCSKCQAWRGAFGLEPQPEAYIEHTIQILREIRRVMRKDGVVFWDIGDSYSATRWSDARGTGAWAGDRKKEANPVIERSGCNLPAKNLCLIPFRVAIAAQEAGWWVRSVIIWSKPNPMPESVTDRPTESHEYILMLTRSARYYWDADAVREVANYDGRHDTIMKPSGKYGGRNIRNEGDKPNSVHTRGAERWPTLTESGERGRNIRSVWEFPTQPFPTWKVDGREIDHFAVFPEKLPEICIKAATPEVGCCSKCGAPWERIIRHHRRDLPHSFTPKHAQSLVTGLAQPGWRKYNVSNAYSETLDWQPTCKCNADKVPSICLDPFSGAGTTLWVAKRLGRKAVGYELSEEYCALSVERNRQQVLGV